MKRILSLVLVLGAACVPLSAMQGAQDGWDGQRYKENSSPQVKSAVSIIDQFIKDWSFFKRILDAGCGAGDFTAIMANKAPEGAKIIGLDKSTSMIRAAIEAFGQNPDRLEFMWSDLCTMEPLQEPVDLVTCFACLVWIKDQHAALKNIALSMRPGAPLLLSCSAQPMDDIFIRAFTVTTRTDKWADHFTDYCDAQHYYPQTVEGLSALFTSVGLTPIKVTPLQREYPFQNIDKFADWVFAFASDIEAIKALGDLELQKEFIKDVATYYYDLLPSEQLKEDGAFVHKLPLLIAMAIKSA